MILERKEKIMFRGIHSRLDDYLEEKDYDLAFALQERNRFYFRCCSVAEYSSYEENKKVRFTVEILEQEKKIKIDTVFLEEGQASRLAGIAHLNDFLYENYDNIINYLTGDKKYENVLKDVYDLYNLTNDGMPEIMIDFMNDTILKDHRKIIIEKETSLFNKLINKLKK